MSAAHSRAPVQGFLTPSPVASPLLHSASVHSSFPPVRGCRQHTRMVPTPVGLGATASARGSQRHSALPRLLVITVTSPASELHDCQCRIASCT
eukprot:365070-Chlamydomonas_euryale.AAC.5